MSDFVVVESVEAPRRCGFRKPSKDGVGVYLVGPAALAACGRLPFALDICPTCSHGIHPSRGWTWIDPLRLIGRPDEPCGEPVKACAACLMGLGVPDGQHGLVWIGEKFYPSPRDFLTEAQTMGVSRKIKAIPADFELGHTVVYLAHRLTPRVRIDPDTGAHTNEPGPAVFSAFRPTGIDLVVRDAAEIPPKAVHLAERHGARIVVVVRQGEQTDLGLDDSEPDDNGDP